MNNVTEEIVMVNGTATAVRYITNECGFETSDGNQDDPSYAYCSLPHAHAGDHGEWRV